MAFWKDKLNPRKIGCSENYPKLFLIFFFFLFFKNFFSIIRKFFIFPIFIQWK